MSVSRRRVIFVTGVVSMVFLTGCATSLKQELPRMKALHLIGVYVALPSEIRLTWSPYTVAGGREATKRIPGKVLDVMGVRRSDKSQGEARDRHEASLYVGRNPKPTRIRGVCRGCEVKLHYKFDGGTAGRLSGAAEAILRRDIGDVFAPESQTSALQGIDAFRVFVGKRVKEYGNTKLPVNIFTLRAGAAQTMITHKDTPYRNFLRENPGHGMAIIVFRPHLRLTASTLSRNREIQNIRYQFEVKMPATESKFEVFSMPASLLGYNAKPEANLFMPSGCLPTLIYARSRSKPHVFRELKPANVKSVGWRAEYAAERFVVEGGLYDTSLSSQALEQLLKPAVQQIAREFAVSFRKGAGR